MVDSEDDAQMFDEMLQQFQPRINLEGLDFEL